MVEWTFLTKHAQALLCISHDPGIRLLDIAAALAITERRAFGIVSDLADAGYVIKVKDGRRNRYEVQTHLLLPDGNVRKKTVGELLELLGPNSNKIAPGRGLR
jgi:DNA-binding IclR family transcriptional regulator